MGTVNNVTFVMPTTSLLQAHYFNEKGVFTDDFPGHPPHVFNYTGPGPRNLQATAGTKVYRLPFNATVQVVLQDTGILLPEDHPIHLHGFNVFGVGRGMGNFNQDKDPKRFNLVDPVERNTIGVPSGGWVAIRFRADNPGTCNHLPLFFQSAFDSLPTLRKCVDFILSPSNPPCTRFRSEFVRLIFYALFTCRLFFLHRILGIVLPESSRDFCRGLVHALPFGSAHDMGAKDGIPGGQWEVS